MFEIMPKLLALEWGAELKRVKPPIFFVEQRGNNFSVQLVFARAIGDAIQLVDSILDADWTCVIIPEKKGNNVVMCKTSQICEITLGKSANIHELAAIIKWKIEMSFENENTDLLYASGDSVQEGQDNPKEN
tara:strand:+ start:6905 stop:7300 length:396 start_codon:yes stop_codon:yes gene_type:complete